MFDIGISEIGLVAVVALIVLGPEKLPRVARTGGALLRKARASWQSVRDEIERELAAEELKRSVKETMQAADPRQDIDTLLKPAPVADTKTAPPSNDEHV